LSIALPAVASATPAHPDGGSHKIKSGTTTLTADQANFLGIIGAGYGIGTEGGATQTGTGGIFKVTGGSLNGKATAGTVKQSGGLYISKGSKKIELNDAVANVATHKVTATVTGKGKGFLAFTLSNPKSKSVSKKGATLTDYTISIAPGLTKYLDKQFKTTVFKKYKELGTATTKVTFK
jgi:hypothetical protein